MTDNEIPILGKETFPYGNYPHYYSYRFKKDLNEALDPRITTISEALCQLGLYPEGLNSALHSKRCLDIGCNSGRFSIEVARQFNPAWCKCIDIDPKLVNKSRRSLYLACEQHLPNLKFPQDRFGCIDFHHDNLPVRAGQFPRNIRFSCGNILDSNFGLDKYDVVFCMSVTKWIHLNWGDDGIRRLFAKVHQLLQSGGLFILEPQAFETYKRRSKISEVWFFASKGSY